MSEKKFIYTMVLFVWNLMPVAAQTQKKITKERKEINKLSKSELDAKALKAARNGKNIINQ